MMCTLTTNMKIIHTVQSMRSLSDELRKTMRISLVPTMGFLHEGHLSLVRQAKKLSDITIVSIFVNPIQFGPKEDLSRYPRDFGRDSSLLEKEGTDIIFYPSSEEMYLPSFSTFIEVQKLQDHLCGKTRTGHFVGVATVVAKLFNITKPHLAVFGQKDYQQLIVIEKMVRDLNIDIEIVAHPTVRESDGLAMSSRNTYLNASERQKALQINLSLKEAENLFKKGERNSTIIKNTVINVLHRKEGVDIEYVEVCNTDTLEEQEVIDKKAVLAIACRVGKTRLIDNTILMEA